MSADFLSKFNGLSKEKKDRILRLVFAHKTKNEQSNLENDIFLELKRSVKKTRGFYKCPVCKNEDRSLAEWRRIQSRDEKWNEFLLKWFQKKKSDRKFSFTSSTVRSTSSPTLVRDDVCTKLQSMISFSQNFKKKLDKSLNNMSDVREEDATIVESNYHTPVVQPPSLRKYGSSKSKDPKRKSGNDQSDSQQALSMSIVATPPQINLSIDERLAILRSSSIKSRKRLDLSNSTPNTIDDSLVSVLTSTKHLENTEAGEDNSLLREASNVDLQDSLLDDIFDRETPSLTSIKSPTQVFQRKYYLSTVAEDTEASNEPSNLRKSPESSPPEITVEETLRYSRKRMSRRTTIFETNFSSSTEEGSDQEISKEAETNNSPLRKIDDHLRLPSPENTGGAITVCSLTDNAK